MFARTVLFTSILFLGITTLNAQQIDLEVRVTSGGEPVTDLEAADFTLKENGKAQKISQFTFVKPHQRGGPAPDQPTWIYVALQITPREWPQVKTGLMKFIDDELRPDYQVSLGGAPFTSDRALLAQYVEDGPPAGGGMPVLWQVDDNLVSLEGRLALQRYLTVQRAMAIRPGKKSVVLFRKGLSIDEEQRIGSSGPGVNQSRIMRTQRGQPGMAIYKADENKTQNQAFFDRFASEALHSRVAFYVGETSGVKSISGADQHGILQVAERTGGRVVYSNDYSEVFDFVTRDSTQYYILSYTPADKKQNGRPRNINVAVNRPNTKVTNLEKYLEPKPFKKLDETERMLHLQRALMLQGDSTGFPVQISHSVFRDGFGAPVFVYSVGVHPSHLDTKSGSKGVEVDYTVGVQLIDPNTLSAVAYDERHSTQAFAAQAIQAAKDDENVMVESSATLSADPGKYLLRAVVRDEKTGEVGGLTTPLEVADLSAEFSPSSILITRRGQQSEELPAPEPPLGAMFDIGQWRFLPECSQVFKTGEPIFMVYDVYNLPDSMLREPPPLQLAVEKDGQPVPVALAGQPVLMAERKKVRFIAVITNSADLDPGEYTVFAGVPSATGTADLTGKFTLVAQ